MKHLGCINDITDPKARLAALEDGIVTIQMQILHRTLSVQTMIHEIEKHKEELT